MGSEGTWQQTRRNDGFDLVLTAAVGLLAAVSLYMGGDPELVGEDFADYSRPVGITLVSVCVLPLAFRRRFPLIVLVVTTTAYMLHVLQGVPEQTVTVVVVFMAFYSAGAYGERGRNLVRVLCGATLLVQLVLSATVLDTTRFIDELREQLTFVPVELFLAFYVIQNSFYFAGAWMMGDVMRSRRQREAELEATAEHLRRVQAENARQAVLEERMHIARELHDVVAHHVAVMGVQAGAARRIFDRQPEAVPELLSTVEDSSRQAVDELHQMLGVLRREDGAEPGLGQLDELIDQMRQAGLDLQTNFDGIHGERMPRLPDAVDRVSYRVVQEALTNTVKHAGSGATTELALRHRPDALEIRVSDNGPATSSVAPEGKDLNGGYGLAGMCERVTMLGGRLEAGPLPDAGFQVWAQLPLAAADPDSSVVEEGRGD